MARAPASNDESVAGPAFLDRAFRINRPFVREPGGQDFPCDYRRNFLRSRKLLFLFSVNTADQRNCG